MAKAEFNWEKLVMFTKSINNCWFGTVLVCASALFLLGGAFLDGASAATIDIEYTGLDISYDGTDITDAGGGTDPLTSVVIELDGVQQGPVLTTGLSVDLEIPDVLNLAVGGDSTTSSTGGFLNLDLGGGNSIDLDLNSPVSIEYLDIAGIFQFVFAASVANVNGQNLPLGLQVGSQVDMSFQTGVTSFTDNGTDLLTFVAEGTGRVSGDAVPEPSTIAMLLLATAGLVGIRRRMQ